MISQLKPAAIILGILTILTGLFYPLVVTGLAQLLFPTQANGSIVYVGDVPAGSRLIGQLNDEERYFWPRPSATEYGTLPSGASNLGPISADLAALVNQRASDFRVGNGLNDSAPVPIEMLFASGSGLDPHISPDAARLQIRRVAAARGLDEQQVAGLVDAHTENPQLGVFGQPRVNVLLLNLALDELE